jgi:phospholipid transport system substrate-binding protein
MSETHFMFFSKHSLPGRWPRRRRLAHRILAMGLLAIGVAASAASGSDPQGAYRLITSVSDRLLSVLGAEGQALFDNPRRVHQLVEQNLLPHIDFDQMSRLVLGKAWRRATPEQRKRFTQEFRLFLVRFYTTSLIEYTRGNEIPRDAMRFLPLRAEAGDTKVTVRSEVRQPGGGQNIPVNYQFALSDGQWKVYDVGVDGVSLVANYRTSFQAEIRNEGLDGLIARLAKRNSELERR